MSGLPANFPCPWCGMSYPARPVLIGKPVRCKGCRNAFVLQPDGTALKIEDQPAAAASAPAKPAPVPTGTADGDGIAIGEAALAEPAAAAPEPARPGSGATQRPTSERLGKGARKSKSEILEATRAKIASDLATVAAKAANTEAAKREERKSERLAKVGGAAAKPGDDKQRNRKAVLTGEGERQHREQLLWLVGALVALGLGVLLLVALNFRSGVRAALDAYTAEVPGGQAIAYGNAIRARAWLAATPSQPGGPAISLELADAVFAAEQVIELAPAKEALARLKGMRPLAGTSWWIQPADAAKARAAIAGAGGSPGKALAQARIRAIEQKAWLAQVQLAEDERAVLLDLIAGVQQQGGIDFAKRILDDGDVPERLRLRPFAGRRGDLRFDLGPPPYKVVNGPYQGVMLRIEGVGWPIGWKVLSLVALTAER